MVQLQVIPSGHRAFSSAAAQIWNHIHIPTTIRVSPSLDSFKRQLKTTLPRLATHHLLI